MDEAIEIVTSARHATPSLLITAIMKSPIVRTQDNNDRRFKGENSLGGTWGGSLISFSRGGGLAASPFACLCFASVSGMTMDIADDFVVIVGRRSAPVELHPADSMFF